MFPTPSFQTGAAFFVTVIPDRRSLLRDRHSRPAQPRLESSI